MEFKELYFLKQKYLKAINENKKDENKKSKVKDALEVIGEHHEESSKINIKNILNLLKNEEN